MPSHVPLGVRSRPMVLAAPIDWLLVRNALRDWFSGVTGLTTVWANQAVPPDYPFAVLTMSGPVRLGGQDEVRYATDLGRDVGKEVGVQVLGLRHITVACEVLVEPADAADPTKDALHYLSIAQSSLGLPSTLAGLSAAGLAFVSESGIEVADETIDGKVISKGRTDVRCALASYLEERTGFIKKIEVSSTGLGKVNLTKEPHGDLS